MNLNQITVPSTNVDAAKTFYSKLGLKLIVDAGHYLRFECPDGDSTFSVHHVDSLSNEHGTSVYFEHEDLDAKVESLSKDGIHFELMPTDQPWLWREARLKDPDGNQIILYYAGDNRKNPPWRIN